MYCCGGNPLPSTRPSPPAASFVLISPQRSGQRTPARGRGYPEQTLPRGRAPTAAPRPPARGQAAPRPPLPHRGLPLPLLQVSARPERPARQAPLTMALPAARLDCPAAAQRARLCPPARQPVGPQRTVGTQDPRSAAGGATPAPPSRGRPPARPMGACAGTAGRGGKGRGHVHTGGRPARGGGCTQLAERGARGRVPPQLAPIGRRLAGAWGAWPGTPVKPSEIALVFAL